MPGLNASEIRVAGTGRILVADKNTAPPADIAEPWDAAWQELGYTNQDGVKFVQKDKIEPVETWQAVAPIRYVYNDRALSLEFSLLQVNADTLALFFAGGTAPVTVTNGVSLHIPAAPRPVERALGVEFTDGPDVVQRFIILRGVVTEAEEMSLTRTSAVTLGVTFTAMTPETTDGEPLAIWQMSTPPAAVTAAATAATGTDG